MMSMQQESIIKTSTFQQLRSNQQLSKKGEGARQNLCTTAQWHPITGLDLNNPQQHDGAEPDALDLYLSMELPPPSPPSVGLAAATTVLFCKEASGSPELSSCGHSVQHPVAQKAKVGRRRKTNPAPAQAGSGSAGHGSGRSKAAQDKATYCTREEDAKKQVQALMLQHKEQQAVNQQLKQNFSFLLDWQEQLDVEHNIRLAVQRSPSPATCIPATCSEVSFAALPHASAWDDAWVDRVRRLSCQDLLVLRRQWLQQSALLLPAAELHGPGCDSYTRLVELHSRHIALVQSVVTLMPETWLQMSQFDMETLQPVAALSRDWLSSLFCQIFPAEVVEAAKSISREYEAQSMRLCAEYHVLLRQYQVLAEGMGVRLHASSSRALPAGYRKLPSSGSGASPTLDFQPLHPSMGDDAVTELDVVAQLIQANTQKQLALLKQFLCRMQHSRLPPSNVKIGLLTYPMAVNALDLSRGLLPNAQPGDK